MYSSISVRARVWPVCTHLICHNWHSRRLRIQDPRRSTCARRTPCPRHSWSDVDDPRRRWSNGGSHPRQGSGGRARSEQPPSWDQPWWDTWSQQQLKRRWKKGIMNKWIVRLVLSINWLTLGIAVIEQLIGPVAAVNALIVGQTSVAVLFMGLAMGALDVRGGALLGHGIQTELILAPRRGDGRGCGRQRSQQLYDCCGTYVDAKKTYDPIGVPCSPRPSCSCSDCAPLPCRRIAARSRRSPAWGCRWCKGRTGRSSRCARTLARRTFLGTQGSPRQGHVL